MRSFTLTLMVLMGVSILVVMQIQNAPIIKAAPDGGDGPVFIVDQRGERWEITQAVSLGFDPDGFEFGIGRNAIVPLGDEYLNATPAEIDEKERVIGISSGDEAHAYRVQRLNLHEVANTTLDGMAIAAAY